MENTKISAQPEKQGQEPEVTLYSTPSCPYCIMAKEYLSAKGVKFTEYDVSSDRAKAKEMIMRSGQSGVPVLEINGRIIVGFDRQLIEDALKRPKPPRRDVLLQNIIFDPFQL